MLTLLNRLGGWLALLPPAELSVKQRSRYNQLQATEL